MKYRILFLLTLLFSFLSSSGKSSPVEIKYTVMDLYALRYYPFSIKADSIVEKLINQTNLEEENLFLYKKTSIDFIGNKEIIERQVNYSIQSNDFLYKYLLNPYIPWIQFATPLKEDNRELVMTLGLHEETREKDNVVLQDKGIYHFAGKRNVAFLMDRLFNDIHLFKEKNEVMFSFVESPLASKGMNSYSYFLSATKKMDGKDVYEIVFYPKDVSTAGFTGYLYVTTSEPYCLTKAIFTLNNSNSMNFTKDVLFIQHFREKDKVLTPIQKKYILSIGDEFMGSLVVNRLVNYEEQKEPLTLSEKKIEDLVEVTEQTRAFSNVKMATRLLLTDYFSPSGEKGIVELGPISRMISYNDIEGFRFRVGGNTTLNLHKQWLVGGYMAYGVRDKEWKYRGDIMYSFTPKDRDIWEFPKRLLSLTYVRDLNIPGENLLTTNRDFILYSFSQVATREMTSQKLAALNYEHELENNLSFGVMGKFLKDEPQGKFQYITLENGVPHYKKDLISSEICFSMRYAPREVSFQTRDKRRSLRKGDVQINLAHKIGLKNIFGSDYSYHITDAEIYKKIRLPENIGYVNMEVAARKVWNRLPFPYLFVAGGNQSYIFKEDDYNLMNYSEFITDRFIAGNMNFQFNWSPFDLFFKSKIKTNLGAKTIYGPMSDNNNPDLHPELYILNESIKPLNKDPYLEVNVGFSNVLKFFRIEWIQRLTYLEKGIDGKKKNKGSLFVNAAFSF